LHRFEEFLLAVQATDTGRTGHLVPRERVEVGVDFLHVNGHRRDGLGTVDEDVRIVVVGNFSQVGDGVDGSKRVRDVDDAHHLGVVGDQFLRVVHVEVAVVVDTDVLDIRAGSLCDLLPRHHRGVVLHLGHDHLVTGSEFVQPPGVGHEVLGLGGVSRENHLLAAAACADERRDPVVGLLVGDTGDLAQVVESAVDVRVHLPVVLGDGLDHRFRRLCRRCVVQIHELLTVELALENRKIGANVLDIEYLGLGRCHYCLSGVER